MRPKPPAVKRPRRYDATSRRARALQTQAAVVAAAQRLFVRDGFQATTIPAVAAEAGVSQETIYKTFGGKTGLVRAIRERALAGDGPAHAEQRSNALQQEERDPRRIIEGWGRLTIEVAPKVMPILQLVAAGAATDAEMARLRQELDRSRLARMRRNARGLGRAGHLRKDMRPGEAAAVRSARLVARALRPLHRKRDDCGPAPSIADRLREMLTCGARRSTSSPTPAPSG
jgi:AcrR family transcriptional regulator